MRLLLALFIFIGIFKNVHAADSWKNSAIQVRSSSSFQKHIDSAITQIFKGRLQGTFCEVFQNQKSLMQSLGVSSSTASSLRRSCPQNTETIALSTKLNPKLYWLVFNGPDYLDSWTDPQNNTYIFVSDNLTVQKLKSILLHEISIALDAKYNFTLQNYLNELPRRGQSFSGNQDDLEYAFFKSMWRPVALSFAALRAFNVESIVHGLSSNTLTHDSCASQFRKVYHTIRKIPHAAPEMSIESMLNSPQEQVISRQSQEAAPQTASQEQDLLNDLLSPSLRIRDFTGRIVTFCEFMAAPALTSNALGNFFSNGPRPRLTGGSGTQNDLISPDDKSFRDSLYEVRRSIPHKADADRTKSRQ